ncbi:MAG: S1C family serine protease [Tannerella sp.]|jgi:S1-C subfamily serine protease|nr:S1C family serine protease [Tannerella sp.]
MRIYLSIKGKVGLCLAVLFVLPLCLRAQDAKEVFRVAAPATVTIWNWNGSKWIGFGSGFFVSPGLIVTNFHVVDGAKELYCFPYPYRNDNYFKIQGYAQANKAIDLAILVAAVPSKSTLRLSNMKVEIGDKIFALGTPDDPALNATISPGIISGDLRRSRNKMLYQFTAPTSHGSSGGPLLNASGEVIGIVSSGVDRDAAQNLNFAIPAPYLKAMLDRGTRTMRPVSDFYHPQPVTKQPSVHSHDVAFAGAGGTHRINLGNPGSYEVDALDADWFSVKKFPNYVLISCDANSDSPRKSWFILAKGRQFIRVNVSQAAAEHPEDSDEDDDETDVDGFLQGRL